MDSQNGTNEYLTCAEAALLLKVSPRTLNRWNRLRKGPPRIKIGRTVYYRPTAIDRWLIGLENGGFDHA